MITFITFSNDMFENRKFGVVRNAVNRAIKTENVTPGISSNGDCFNYTV